MSIGNPPPRGKVKMGFNSTLAQEEIHKQVQNHAKAVKELWYNSNLR